MYTKWPDLAEVSAVRVLIVAVMSLAGTTDSLNRECKCMHICNLGQNKARQYFAQ